MPSLLESQRLSLEELDRIELEIAERIRRNPDIYKAYFSHNLLGGVKRPLKQTLLQQHEIKHFLDQYSKKSQQINQEVIKNGENLFQEIQEIKLDLSGNFKLFGQKIEQLKNNHKMHPNQPLDELSQLYSMFSSQFEYERYPKKRKIVSAFCSDLRLDSIFSLEENYGQFLDLSKFYTQWQNLPGNKEADINLHGYISNFSNFKKSFSSVNKNSKEYQVYLTSLYAHLCDFWINIQPLNEPEKNVLAINAKGVELQNKSDESIQLNQDGSVFCKPCQKSFAKETVYKGHLTGKKHLKNLKGNGKAPQTTNQVPILEFKIREISVLLEKQIQETIKNVERRSHLSERERLMDIEARQQESEDEYDFEGNDEILHGNSDEEGVETLDNGLKVAMGPDGKPIPYWLWKLNGLSLEFNCELCGNVKYHGRKEFESHFQETRHGHGLRCLGIKPQFFSWFKDISGISEATELWQNIQKEHGIVKDSDESNIETEDNEGNVMSVKVYNELKKQGLL
ncbi:hypothetical protein LJB42_002646 [Komagataella kurtzmanii]|nr:hypothetical protein LJB42_002646 [Komagataella kurtzmanii]